MRCSGFIKFYDHKVNKFGYITNVESEFKESLKDFKFYEIDLVSEKFDELEGVLVVFEIRTDKKHIASKVRILEYLETEEVLSIIPELEAEKLLMAYNILSRRGFQFNDDQLTQFYQRMSEDEIDTQYYRNIWEISRKIDLSQYEIFFKFLDKNVFDFNNRKFRYSKSGYLDNSVLLDEYISRCIELKSLSVYEIFIYLREINLEKSQRLIPTILEISCYDKPHYYWHKILDSLPDPNEFFRVSDLPNEIIESYLLAIITGAKYDQSVCNKVLMGIRVLISRNRDICDELLSQYISNGISSDETTNWCFISNYWDKVLCIQSDYQINQGLGKILEYYPQNTKRLILYIVKSKKTLYPNLIKALALIRGKTELLTEICEEIPDLHLKFPIFFITQINENVKTLPRGDFISFSNELRKIFNKGQHDKLTLEEQVALKYCLNEGLHLEKRDDLCTFLYEFFLSEIDFFLMIREHLLSSERDSLFENFKDFMNQINTRWNDDHEIKFLASFIGILRDSNQSLDRTTLEHVLKRIDPSFEILIIYYFIKKNINETTTKEKFRDFIIQYGLKSFCGLLLKNLLDLEQTSEKVVLTRLKKTFYDGYDIFSKSGIMELNQYFMFHHLVRKCKGRTQFTSIDDEYQTSYKFAHRRHHQDYGSNGPSPKSFFCEGKFWKYAGETEKFCDQPSDTELYWCAGDYCIEPNRKSNFENDFSRFSLCEVLEVYNKESTDLLYATIAGWANRIVSILPRLQCRTCRAILYPVPYVPKRLGHYATPIFNCINVNCPEHGSVVRLTHCLKCAKLIDSRDAEKCTNGLLICHDENCKGCCDEHAKKDIKPIYRQKRDV